MTRRNWMAFAAMLVAALFLAGCGGGDDGMAGAMGPPGDAPTAKEEIAAALLSEEVVADMLNSPAAEAASRARTRCSDDA